MSLQDWLLIILTGSELALLFLVVFFFARLRKSEELLTALRESQSGLLAKLDQNARLEQEMVESFEDRQVALARLDAKLESRREELEKLLKQASEFTRSPDFLRQLILTGHRKGQSTKALAKATGLSQDEVELILEEVK
jgi:hypothetical protein